MSNAEIVYLVAIGAVLFLFLVTVFYMMRGMGRSVPPYRKAVSRVHAPDGNGEAITLECGHAEVRR